jgi:hypothetical protein
MISNRDMFLSWSTLGALKNTGLPKSVGQKIYMTYKYDVHIHMALYKAYLEKATNAV